MKLTHKTFNISYTPEEKAIVYEQLFWFNISICGQFYYLNSLIEAKKLKSKLEKEEQIQKEIRQGNFTLITTILIIILWSTFFLH